MLPNSLFWIATSFDTSRSLIASFRPPKISPVALDVEKNRMAGSAAVLSFEQWPISPVATRVLKV